MVFTENCPSDYPPKWVAFGKMLREARMSRKIALRKFAGEIGYSPTGVSLVEQGDLTQDSIALAMCVALDVNWSSYHAARFDK